MNNMLRKSSTITLKLTPSQTNPTGNLRSANIVQKNSIMKSQQRSSNTKQFHLKEQMSSLNIGKIRSSVKKLEGIVSDSNSNRYSKNNLKLDMSKSTKVINNKKSNNLGILLSTFHVHQIYIHQHIPNNFDYFDYYFLL